jgi:hypothetical protein
MDPTIPPTSNTAHEMHATVTARPRLDFVDEFLPFMISTMSHGTMTEAASGGIRVTGLMWVFVTVVVGRPPWVLTQAPVEHTPPSPQ